jgi:alpha-beta hydrolase superfamily lysophospholipase/thiol-disulfide isomerase/thioredoxin
MADPIKDRPGRLLACVLLCLVLVIFTPASTHAAALPETDTKEPADSKNEASENGKPAATETKPAATESKRSPESKPVSASDPRVTPCISWMNPLVKPRIALLCIHGLGLYSGSYHAFGMRMARLGIITYAIDVRGFGSWMKAEGHEQVDFAGCLEDVGRALQTIRQANPGLPVFLMGESMGGAIALRAASKYPDLVEGLISSVPAGERFQQKRTELKVALEFLRGPNRKFDIGSKIVKQATQDDKLRQDWSSNPLDRMDLSPHELIQFQSFMNDNHDAAKLVKDDPVLFVQGTNDKLVKPEGTWELFNQLATPDKYFLAVPSEHLIFEEGQDRPTDFGRHAAMISQWMHMVAAKDGIITPNDRNNTLKDEISQIVEDPNVRPAAERFVQGENNQALTSLETLVKAHPENLEAQYWLALVCVKTGRIREARQHILASLPASTQMRFAGPPKLQGDKPVPNKVSPKPRVGKESALPQPAKVVPKLSASKESAEVSPMVADSAPSVVALSTGWCEQCKSIDNFFRQAEALLGNNVKFVKVDAEDPANKQLVGKLNISLVPAFVYMDDKGGVVSTLLGQTNFINFANGLRSIVH